MNPSDITPKSTIEEIVEAFPQAVTFLMERYQIRVICCGAPLWATLEELASKHGVEPQRLSDELGEFLS